MNWNTSSSFENFEEVRQRRTQLVKRASSSAVRRKISDKDKLEDDVVNRICRDNNRTVQDPGVNPISKVIAKVKARVYRKDVLLTAAFSRLYHS